MNWPDLREASYHTKEAGAEGLIKSYRELFSMFGVPEEISSDGRPEFKSNALAKFLETWDIRHRKASAYNPQSNARAEVSVKAMKCLLRDNTDKGGKLNTDEIMRGMLQLRNTPERNSGLSPAQVLLGCDLKDGLTLRPPFLPRTSLIWKDSPVQEGWKELWEAKEHSLRVRLGKQLDKLEWTRSLEPSDSGRHSSFAEQDGQLSA